MNKIIDKLDDKFQLFINEESDDFVNGLFDYVEFVKELPEANNLISNLEEKQKADLIKISAARVKDSKEKTVVSSVMLERLENKNKAAIWSAWSKINALVNIGYDSGSFIRLDFIPLCLRFHKYLIDKLEQQEKIVHLDDRSEIEFDESKGLLRINNKEIKFSKTSKQYEVLRIIFKDKKETYRDWQFSEISELLDYEGLHEWKKIYDIVKEIQRKIAAKTGIEDFFHTTTQSVIINKRYSAKS